MKELSLFNRKIIAAFVVASYLILLGVGSVHFHHNHLHTNACDVVISQTKSDDSHTGFGSIEHCTVQNVLNSTNPALIESSMVSVPFSPELTNITECTTTVISILTTANLLRAPPVDLV